MPTVVELKEQLLSHGMSMRDINKLKLKGKLIQKLQELQADNDDKENAATTTTTATRRLSTQNVYAAKLIGLDKQRPSSDQFL
jgi:hypothetical protein